MIAPVVDLRLKLACESAGYTDLTGGVVLNVHGRDIGVVVDSASDVLALSVDSIKPAAALNASEDAGYIVGMCQTSSKLPARLHVCSE